MIYLGWALSFLLAVRLLISFINWISKPDLAKLCKELHENFPLISILIPARNEEKNIGNLLKDLSELTYLNYEVLVYDDMSDDKTAEIVSLAAIKNNKIKLIKGNHLPPGWVGKNYGCFNLANEANGEYLIFIDADVRIAPNLISNAVFYAVKKKLSLLSLFPVQTLITKGEKLTVPIMNWVLLSLLPMFMIRFCSWSAFSAANGQFMLFYAKKYKYHNPHFIFRNHRVEDLAIFHFYKKKRERVDTILTDRSLTCRMYTTYDEAISGFAKNIFHFFGGSKMVTVLFAVLTTLTPLYLLVFNGIIFFLASLVSIVLIRLFVSLASSQNIIENLKYMLFQHFTFIKIIITAYHKQKNKSLTWKERHV